MPVDENIKKTLQNLTTSKVKRGSSCGKREQRAFYYYEKIRRISAEKEGKQVRPENGAAAERGIQANSFEKGRRTALLAKEEGGGGSRGGAKPTAHIVDDGKGGRKGGETLGRKTTVILSLPRRRKRGRGAVYFGGGRGGAKLKENPRAKKEQLLI